MAKAKADEVEEIKDLTPEEEAVMYGESTATAEVGTRGLLRERLGVFRRRAVNQMVKEGVDRAEALEMVGAIGDGTFLDWLIKNGPDIIAFVKMIMALFGL